MYMNAASWNEQEWGEEMGRLMSWQFSVQPVFDYLGDSGTVDGDTRSLEPFRVVDTRSVGICEIPNRSVLNNTSQTEKQETYVSFQTPKCLPLIARVVHS